MFALHHVAEQLRHLRDMILILPQPYCDKGTMVLRILEAPTVKAHYYRG